MSTTPSYLRASTDAEVVQYKDWGIPLGRRFRALKLWFLLRVYGLDRCMMSELVEFPGGVMGMAAVHAATSYPLRTSPVLRGAWVLETLLGTPVPPPPGPSPAGGPAA